MRRCCRCGQRAEVAAAEDPATAPSNHSPDAAFDVAVLADGALVLAELAFRAIRRA
ncbi:hypothetical protein [Dactylosporangium sp. CA-092794]|uniref:hypothetical protein n=1 Tax=Dactylosporangium sp. CA-092794 TaxID=3239929 RepID=UPI003D8C9645